MSDAAPGRPTCPACGQPLFGWLQLETPGGVRVLERCEECGLGIAADLRDGAEENLAAMVEVGKSNGGCRLRFRNRASVQASLGGGRWALLETSGCFLTPDSARRVLRAQGLEPGSLRPVPGASLLAMWRTGIASLTFVEDQGARRLYNRLIQALAALPVAVVTLPLELLSWVIGRPGVVEMSAVPAAPPDAVDGP